MTLENQEKNASAALSEMTDRPEDEFEPDLEEHPIPDLDDLEWSSVSDE